MIKHFWIDSKQPLGFQRSLQNAFTMAAVKNLGTHQGDVLIELDSGKLILIEVKEVPNDFIASIQDRRLFNQADGMKQVTPWCFLLLSQDFSYNDQWKVMGMTPIGYGVMGEWTRAHIEGALTSVQARGLMVRTAYKGYVDSIRLIINWVDTADRGSVTSEAIKLSPFDKDDQKLVNLLAWFDGIGVIQAKNFIDWCRKRGVTERFAVWNMAIRTFNGPDKPEGWTNNTIRRNREQLGLSKETPMVSGEKSSPEELPTSPSKTEWIEELDIT